MPDAKPLTMEELRKIEYKVSAKWSDGPEGRVASPLFYTDCDRLLATIRRRDELIREMDNYVGVDWLIRAWEQNGVASERLEEFAMLKEIKSIVEAGDE